jgi:hypothetical protein
VNFLFTGRLVTGRRCFWRPSAVTVNVAQQRVFAARLYGAIFAKGLPAQASRPLLRRAEDGHAAERPVRRAFDPWRHPHHANEATTAAATAAASATVAVGIDRAAVGPGSVHDPRVMAVAMPRPLEAIGILQRASAELRATTTTTACPSSLLLVAHSGGRMRVEHAAYVNDRQRCLVQVFPTAACPCCCAAPRGV